MSIPILATKLYIPPVRARLVTRQRLLERLNEGINRKLSLVSAPAGFGKTTLLSEWVNLSERKTIWVSLDSGDNDLNRFLAYLVAGLSELGSDIGEGVLDVLNSPSPPNLESLLTEIINEISSSAEPFILVLDDYHYITHPEIHSAVTFLIDNQPPQMHLAISGRADPPWPMARLRARSDMTEIRTVDLRFTLEESASFFRKIMQLDLSDEEVIGLESRTEGWVAGLQMAALSLMGRQDSTRFINTFAGSHRFVLDYLVEEVLNQQPEDIQEFLLKTSILERLTEPLCDAVTGGDDSRDMMYELDQANLFLIPLDNERRWYRYHHLFAELLRNRLDQTFPELIPELHSLASQWFEDQGFIEEAIHHAFESGMMDRVAALVEQYAIQVINQSKAKSLLDWIESLPEELLAQRPLLCAYRAWSRYWMGQRDKVEECLQSAERGLADPDYDIPEATRRIIEGYIAAIRAYLSVTQEDVFQLLENAQIALKKLPEGNYMRGIAAVALGATYWGLGDVKRSQIAFQQAADIALTGGFRNLAVSAICYVGIQQEKEGQLVEARHSYELALEKGTTSGGRLMPFACFPLVRLGNLWREWNNLQAASNLIEDGLKRAIQMGHPDILAEAYLAQLRLDIAREDIQGAKAVLDQLDRLLEVADLDPWADTWIEECRLMVWQRQGNLEAMSIWAAASGLEIESEFSYLHDLNHLNLARVFVNQARLGSDPDAFNKAHALLSDLLQVADDAGWVQAKIKALILLALTYQAQQKLDLALGTLKTALGYATQGGFMRVFLDEGDTMVRLLERASEAQILPDYVNRLLAATREKSARVEFVTSTTSPRGSNAELVEPLTEREMQVLRMLTSELSVPEIADELIISVSTARTHVKNIYSKLEVHSRYQAVARARALSLL